MSTTALDKSKKQIAENDARITYEQLKKQLRPGGFFMRAMGIDLGTTTVSVIMMDAKSGEILGSRTIAHQAFLEGRIPESVWKISVRAR